MIFVQRLNIEVNTGVTDITPENVEKKFRDNFVFILFPELFRFPVLVLNARKAEIVPENVENHIPELFRFLLL